MKQTIRPLTTRPGLLAIAGALSMVGLVLAQATLSGLPAATAADGNDDFPGNTLGGGTQWVSPTSYARP